MYLDFKQHYDVQQRDSQVLKRILAEESQARKQLEINQEERLKDMQRKLEARQREIETMQTKMTLPVDSDIMRMKVLKEIEGRHRIE